MNGRLFTPLLFALALLQGPMAHADESDPLLALYESLSPSVAQIEAKYSEQHQKLRENYTQALGRLEKELAPDGDLDPILVVRNEMAAAEKPDESLPELPTDAPAKLVTLRKKFDETEASYALQRDTSLIELRVEHDRKLQALEQSLTRSGDVDGAVAVRKAREALPNDPRFPEPEPTITPEKNPAELTKELEGSEWRWYPADKEFKNDGQILKLSKGGVLEVSWQPEQGKWKVLSGTQAELTSERWKNKGIMTFDQDLKNCELRSKGTQSNDILVGRGVRIQEP